MVNALVLLLQGNLKRFVQHASLTHSDGAEVLSHTFILQCVTTNLQLVAGRSTSSATATHFFFVCVLLLCPGQHTEIPLCAGNTTSRTQRATKEHNYTGSS